MTEETKEIIGAVQEMFLDVKQEMKEMKQEIKDMNERLTNIEQPATKTALMPESKTNKKDQLLAEGYLPLVEKVDTMAEDMDIVKFNVDIVKKGVTTIPRSWTGSEKPNKYIKNSPTLLPTGRGKSGHWYNRPLQAYYTT